MANFLHRAASKNLFAASRPAEAVCHRLTEVIHLPCSSSWRSLQYHKSLGVYTTRGFRTCHRLDDTYRVNMPSLSPTMTEGTIVSWSKKEGDKISPGDVLCEIQTDKAVVSMEHDEEGILAKILVPENTPDIKVGTLIALTVDEGDDWKNVEVPADAPPPKKESAPKAAAVASPATISAPSQGSDRLLGPAVKNYLKQYGLDSSNVSASGPHGTVTKGDVLKHVEVNKITPVSAGAVSSSTPSPTAARPMKAKGHTGPATFVDLEVSNMRKTIAKRLIESKSTIPHAYGTVQCNMNGLIAFRKQLTAAGLKVSVNDMIIKSVANALERSPTVNAVWEGGQVKQKGQVDISVAVTTPNGLITPIVPNTGARDVYNIASMVRTLADKARAGKLQPHEFMGGTFSISNLGMFGINNFYAIINPPQCAILAVGGTSAELGENGKPVSLSKLMLSYDARVIADDDAAKFLSVLKNEVECINEISMGIYDIQTKKTQVEEDEALIAQSSSN